MDVTKNVSGVFRQILINGSASTFYHDVPELKNMGSSDTISVITIGINPADLRKAGICGMNESLPEKCQSHPRNLYYV